MIIYDFKLRPTFIDIFFLFNSFKIYYEENLNILEKEIEAVDNE
jgi:hypothetical protein